MYIVLIHSMYKCIYSSMFHYCRKNRILVSHIAFIYFNSTLILKISYQILPLLHFFAFLDKFIETIKNIQYQRDLPAFCCCICF